MGWSTFTNPQMTSDTKRKDREKRPGRKDRGEKTGATPTSFQGGEDWEKRPEKRPGPHQRVSKAARRRRLGPHQRVSNEFWTRPIWPPILMVKNSWTENWFGDDSGDRNNHIALSEHCGDESWEGRKLEPRQDIFRQGIFRFVFAIRANAGTKLLANNGYSYLQLSGPVRSRLRNFPRQLRHNPSLETVVQQIQD